MAAATDVRAFVGVLVHWRGTVQEVTDDRTRLVVESDGQRFSVKLEAPLASTIQPGSAVEVDGVVLERSAPQGPKQGILILLGREVRQAAASGPPTSGSRRASSVASP